MKRIMFGVVMAGWLAGWVTTIFNYLIFHASPWQNFLLFEDTLIKDIFCGFAICALQNMLLGLKCFLQKFNLSTEKNVEFYAFFVPNIEVKGAKSS